MEPVAKTIIPECWDNQKFSRGKSKFYGIGHYDKHFVQNTSKKALQGNILEFFLLDTLKITFWTENVTQRWIQSGPFFSEIRTFLKIFKKGHGGPSPFLLFPSWTPVNMDEYALLSLNIAKYLTMPGLWICLIILHVWQGFEDASGPNVPGFWICHDFTCKYHTEFWISLNMAQHVLIIPQYASICLNVSQYAWKWLKIAEFP